MPDLPRYSERATALLRGRGMLRGNDLRLELEKQFRAICPSCSRWISFADVFTLHLSQEVDATFTSYGPVSRMRDGLCPNADCAETHGLVVWAGHPATIEDIDSTMQYFLRNLPPDGALRRYYRTDVVAFLADVIALNVSARRSCSTGLILRADTGEEPVAVNLTIVRGTPDPEWTRINIFPSGRYTPKLWMTN